MKDWQEALKLEASALEIEALGMMAENQHRLSLGQPVAYRDDDLFEIARQVREVAGKMNSGGIEIP